MAVLDKSHSPPESGPDSLDREPIATSSGWYDLVIVGAGWEAITAAQAALGRGRRLAVVPGMSGERSSRIEDPISPCTICQTVRREEPSQTARPATGAGQVGRPGIPRLVEQLRRQAAGVERDKALGRLAADGVQILCGAAVFRGRDLLEVAGQPVPFRKVLLATGSIAGPIEVPGADEAGCLTPETVAELGAAPVRVAVVGAGPVECHWAQVFGRMGSEVHVLVGGARILPDEDPEAAALVQEQFVREGIRLHFDCGRVLLERAGKEARAVLIVRGDQREKLFVDGVFVAGPRRPGLGSLALDAAGVHCGEQGVVVNDRLRTSNRRILAAGTVCGGEWTCPEVVRATLRRAVDNALGRWPRRLERSAVPCCVQTDPQIVRIGISPQEAAAQGLEVRTYRASEAECPGSGEGRRGFVAVHVRSRSGRVVGATIAAERAMELAGVVALVMRERLPLEALAGAVPCRAARMDVFRLAAERCREAQPVRFWSVPLEALVTWWRRWRPADGRGQKGEGGGGIAG